MIVTNIPISFNTFSYTQSVNKKHINHYSVWVPLFAKRTLVAAVPAAAAVG